MSEPAIDKNIYSSCGRACVPFDNSRARQYWALVGGKTTKNEVKARNHAEAIAKIIRDSEK